MWTNFTSYENFDPTYMLFIRPGRSALQKQFGFMVHAAPKITFCLHLGSHMNHFV